MVARASPPRSGNCSTATRSSTRGVANTRNGPFLITWQRPNARGCGASSAGRGSSPTRTIPDGAGHAGPQARADQPRTRPASLREGLAETLTFTQLGVAGTLTKTLATTNPMESTIDIVRVHARNVKRRRDGDMRLRWAAAGMLRAEQQYRRVKGYKQLDKLADGAQPEHRGCGRGLTIMRKKYETWSARSSTGSRTSSMLDHVGI